MAVAMTVTKDSVETLMVEISLTGLTPGVKYDVYRLQVRYLGDDDLGVPQYDLELPDRKALWSSIAHRVAWTAPAATATFRDYETPMRATQYFVVPTSAIGPHEYTDWDTPYPTSRGVLSPTVVHFDRDLQQLLGAGAKEVGHIIVRSTAELGKYVSTCVIDLDEVKWTARGTEQTVLGNQYPTYVADVRESRRGSIILKVDSLGKFNDLRQILLPSTGAIRPVIFNAGSEPTMLLDDMRVVVLDISAEQITHSDPSLRYLHLDFVEVDPSAPLAGPRIGDNDTLVSKPVANFTFSDTTPAKGQWITLTSTSTGQFSSYDWSIERGAETDNRMGKFYSQGPHRIRWNRKGTKTVKLRVYGPAGAHTRTKTVVVH